MKINGKDAPVCISQPVKVSWEANCQQKSARLQVWEEGVPDCYLFDKTYDSYQLWQELTFEEELESEKRYVFQVVKTFEDGRSETEFKTVRGNRRKWQAQWIGHPQGGTTQTSSQPAPMFRQKIEVDKPLFEAVLYISGLGFYEFRLNNQKTTDSLLNQAFTQYDKTTLFDAWVVTDYLVDGLNTLDILLGNGWYNSFAKDAWDFDTAAWKKPPKVLFELVVTFQDGSEKCYKSDNQCMTGKSSILFDGLRNGEHVDSHHPAFNWPAIGDELFSDSANVVDPPGGYLVLNQMPPIRCETIIAPISIKKLWDNRFLVDFGRNISGWCQLHLLATDEKSEISLRYGEKLSEEGILDQRDIAKFLYSGEFQSDTIQANGQKFSWHPSFVYHGFQYVEVTGVKELTAEMIEAWFIHTDIEPLTKVESSNTTLKWIQEAAVASTLGNYHGIPTDCPQREKNGWTGDVNLSCEQMLRNFDTEQAFIKWLADIQDAQRPSGELPGIVPTTGWGYSVGPAWDSVIINLPYEMYRHKGNQESLRKLLPAMEQYMSYVLDKWEDGLINYGLGDWCAPNYSGNEGDYRCPTAITGTAIVYGCCQKMMEIYDCLQQKSPRDYAQIGATIKKAFREAFIDFSSRIVSETQTAYGTALYFDLFENEEKPQAMKHLVQSIHDNQDRLDCGILGTKYLFPVLFENGCQDLAFHLLTQPEYPGYGYWESLGASTMWEHWLGFHSRNHHMFSSVSEYLFKYLAGIQLTQPGYCGVQIKPALISGLANFSVEQQTPQGVWKVQIEGNRDKVIRLTVPANVEATFFVPEGYQSKDRQRSYHLSVGDYLFELEQVNS